MLREPPLVEMPIATSSGRACAMSWRRKITSVPTSLATARDDCRLHRQRHAGNRREPCGRQHAVHGQVVGVGRRAAVAEEDQLAAAREALVDGERGVADLLGLFATRA